MRTALILLVGVVGLLRAEDPEPPGSLTAEAKKLQGKWKMEAYTVGDAEIREDAIARRRLVVKGDEWTSYIDDTPYRMILTVRSLKAPRQLDLKETIDGQVYIRRCIYRLTGDKLEVCFPLTRGGPRPTTFDKGEGIAIQVFRREKAR
jgi:uncharacterized protein (TIGR03067 family)